MDKGLQKTPAPKDDFSVGLFLWILSGLIVLPVSLAAFITAQFEIFAVLFAAAILFLPLLLAWHYYRNDQPQLLAKNLNEPELAPPIPQMPAEVADIQCQICGDFIGAKNQRMVCESCGTPHCVECWTYNHGKCSIFGCESRRAMLVKGGEV